MSTLPHPLLTDDERVPAPPHVPVAVAAAAWLRGTAGPAGAVSVLLSIGLHLLPGVGLVPLLSLGAGAVGIVLLVLGVALSTASPTASREEPTVLSVPLDGRWADADDAAPGLGNHSYGQAFALGLGVDAPWAGQPGPLGLRPASDSPSFGRPVLAVADATVVRVVDGARDHRVRWGLLARVFGALEAAVRELCGARAVLGNHVVLDLGAGRYAVCAHLQRRSVTVVPGERVLPGDSIAAVGCSGATNEPHLHVQVMDSASPRTAAGLPMRLVAIDPLWR